MTGGLTQRQREALARQGAHGRARVLAVGVDHYDSSSGFDSLKTCCNDARGFADCFRDIPQLNADPDHVRTLVSSKDGAASRGAIIKALLKLVEGSAEGDRLFFYFSGHGHRIAPDDPDAHLVPQDAFSADDPTCLLSLARVKQILSSSPAKQKIIVLDACLTGSSTTQFKSPRPALSRKAFDEYLRNTSGLVVLSSSAADVASSTRSFNPQHSLFTAHLLPALRGEVPEALDDRMLTITSLFAHLSTRIPQWAKSAQIDQRPILNESASGTIVLADFSGPLVTPDAFDLDGNVYDHFDLEGSEPIAVKTILTALKVTTYSQEYLEKRANQALGDHLEEDLGRAVSRLRRQFKWASSVVSVEGAALVFPDGHYTTTYVATGRHDGELFRTLSLQPTWLETPGHVAALLACLDLRPQSIRLALRRPHVLAHCIPKLEAGGWQLESELEHKLEATRDGCTLVLEKKALTLQGLPLADLFAADPDRRTVKTAAAALALLGGP